MKRPGSACGYRMPADQSYLGRPVDPEIVSRVRASLDKYAGPRTAADNERIISAKVGDKKKWDREVSSEYWSWCKKVYEESEPSFKLPEDPRKGMPTQDQYINERVKKGLKDMREKSVEYKAWVASLRQRQAAKIQEDLQAKKAADEEFENAAQERYEERRKRDEAMCGEVAQQESKYWNWLSGMKESVKKRPSSAPAARGTGNESPAALAQKKKAESTRILKTMSSEYSEWLESVSVKKFTLPTAFVDHEDRNRRAAAQKERARQARKGQKTYLNEVKQMERKHHARIMGMVQERLEADRKFDEDHEAFAQSLVAKQEAERQRQREISVRSRKELKGIYQRVKDKPLFLETAYGE